MTLFLKQSTAVVISFGPALDKTDGVTEETGLVSALDHASTGIKLSKNGGALTIRHATVTATTYDAYGMYRVTLDTTDTNTLGTLRMAFNEAATCLPVWQDFMVLPANIFDSIVSGSDLIDVSMTQILGTAVATPATAGVLDVNTKNAGNVAWASGAIVAGAIATGAITNAKFAAGAIDAAAIAADAITDAKVASDVTIASVTGAVGSVTGAVASVTGAVGSVTGNVGGNVVGSVGSVTGLTVTTIEAAIWDADPANHEAVGTFGPILAAAAQEATLTAMKGATFAGATDSLEAIRDRGDAAWATATGFATPTNITAASGITLAPTTGMGNQTANITGNLSGSVGSVSGAVGSVTGAVGSVTGNVGGNVVGSVASVTGLTASDVGAIKTKTDYLPSATAGAAGGLFIAGANAATSITGALTANITGSMSGNVEGNVNGSVGSVVGNVGGNVTGSVGSVVGFTPSNIADIISTLGSPAGASVSVDIAAVKNDTALMKGATFDTATDSLEALRNRGDAAWATATGFSTLDAAGVRTAVGLASANLDTQLTAIDDYLDTEVAAIYNRLGAPAGASIAADIAGITAGSGLDAAGVRAAIGLATANLDTQLAAIDDLVDTEVAAIKAKTDNLPAAPAAVGDIPSAATVASQVRTELTTELGRIDVATSTRLATAGYTAPLDAAGTRTAVGLATANLDTQLGAIDDYLDTEVAAIKAKTDYLPSATAGAAGGLFIAGANAATTVDITGNITGNLSGTVGSVTGAVGSVTGAVGSVTGAVGSVAANGITATSIATDAINAAAVKADAVTKIQTGLATPTNITAAAGIALSAGERTTLANAILDVADGATTNYTLREALEVMLAVLAGKLSGAATATITIRDVNDTKNVVVVTTDASGNRTAATITP